MRGRDQYLFTHQPFPQSLEDRRSESLKGPLEADQANGPILQMGRLRLRGAMRVQARSFIGQLLAPHWGLSLLGGS